MTSLPFILLKALVEQSVTLEFASDELINEDYAVKIMEQTSASLKPLSSEQLIELSAMLREIEAGTEEAAHKEFVSLFLENFDLIEDGGI